MASRVNRRTVDLTGYPDLVVIYLGMRVNRMPGLKTVFGFGPRIANSVEARPDGLLLHENFLLSMFHRTPACASTGATSMRWSDGHGPTRIANGGASFSET